MVGKRRVDFLTTKLKAEIGNFSMQIIVYVKLTNSVIVPLQQFVDNELKSLGNAVML